MAESPIPLCRADIRDEDIERVAESLRSGWITTGPKVQELERLFADFKGVPADRVLAVSSCTAGLHLALLGAGIGPGDEVITTALTFSATVHEIVHVGATPVLVDIDERTWNIDPTGIEGAITPRTRAILVVHYAGRPCDMKEIEEIARKHRLRLIEDCAHAIETRYQGIPAGLFGNFSAFSFYASKNLTTAEGGMLVARDPEDISGLRAAALHGMDRDAWARGKDNKFSYLVVRDGFKYNLSDVHAAIGIGQFGRLGENLRKRRRIWNVYLEAFADLPVQLPAPVREHDVHACHIFTMRVLEGRKRRDELMTALKSRGIASSIHYPMIAIHPYFQQRFRWCPESWPNALAYSMDTITLPLFPGMTDEEIGRVVETVRVFFNKQPLP